MEDAINKIDIPGHYGPHPEAYHNYLKNALDVALKYITPNSNEYRQTFEKVVNSIREEVSDSNNALNTLISK